MGIAWDGDPNRVIIFMIASIEMQIEDFFGEDGMVIDRLLFYVFYIYRKKHWHVYMFTIIIVHDCILPWGQ